MNDAGDQSAYTSASDNYAYLKNPIWWAGLATSESYDPLDASRSDVFVMKWSSEKVSQPFSHTAVWSSYGWLINRFSHCLVANFAAYTLAPPIMVTPLGALSVIVGYVFCDRTFVVC